MAIFELTELASYVQSDLDTATATLAREQAVTYLEAETGVRLVENTATLTYHPRWDDCWIDLPVPTTAVSQVDVDGETLGTSDYKVVENRLYRAVGWGGSRWASESRFGYRDFDDEYVDVEVTLTYGFADGSAPAEFKTWALILASQAYQLAPKVGLQSLRIDDYSETYATGGSQPFSGLSLPPQILGKLRARYGNGARVVEAR